VGNGQVCIATKINYCNESLGMEDGRIKDGDITASSYWYMCGPVPCRPYKGRLNSDAAWLTATPSPNEYLQVDLLKITKLTSIATQGFPLGHYGARYTREYKLKYSNNVASSFQDHGTTFTGNTDANSVVKNAISPPIVARYVRVHSLSWQTTIALRIELYGCKKGFDFSI
ncbi:neuropilin-2-like, partial [Exaiptasia diaphana]|uniref:F5/8 type C domain-containing protein n=1 Tax=Exaiptasia diaphana TaxID=2652724 RepID=A0A913YUZ9_EXADI